MLTASMMWAPSSAGALDQSARAIVVDSVSVQSGANSIQVIIQSNVPMSYRHTSQEDPPGVYLYMTAPTVSSRQAMEKIYNDVIEEIRFVYKDMKSPMGAPVPLNYIYLKLKQPTGYTVVQKDWITVVELKNRVHKYTRAAAKFNPEDNAYKPRSERKKDVAVLPPNPTLQDFLDVGLRNSVALQLAEQDHGVAKLRFFDASRAMFPALTGRYVESHGTMLLDPTIPDDDVDFERREFGLQVGQPIFESGRLYYAMRQASMQKTVSAQNVRKTREEVAFEIKKAYYNLIKAQRAVKLRQSAKANVEQVVEMTRKKKQLEMVTQTEALSAESQYSQMSYKLISEQRDLELAQLKMAALLNLPEDLQEDIPDPKDDVSPDHVLRIETPLATLVQLAQKHRPDLISADYSARYHNYGEKVAKADTRLRIDASGFVGKSGGAFDAEDLQLRSSWNVGLQARMFFLGNSMKGTGTGEKTSPDLGETSRTQTNARTAELGLLDGIKGMADRRQARIARERAANDFEQMRRQVAMDVKEAYYNVEKAILQLRSTMQDMDYRKKDLDIVRQKEKLNLADPSQRMSAESYFVEAGVAAEDAMAFYKVSVASLDKALGVPYETVKGSQ